MNVFFDTNILLDVLARRQPFYEDASSLWSLADNGKIAAFVSAITFPNIYYILQKQVGSRRAKEAMREMSRIFEIVACDGEILARALQMNAPDFEDAIQICSALRIDADYLVTRDASGFAGSNIPVVTPAMFLTEYGR